MIDNGTTSKDDYKNQTTNNIYDQNSMSKIKKIITKSTSHQKKKTKRNVYFIRKNLGPVLDATG